MRRSFVTGPAERGRSVREALVDRFGALADDLLAAGAVFVDRIRADPATASRVLSGGEHVDVEDAPDPGLPGLEVLHEDEHVALVVKPPFVSSTADLRSESGTLLAACRLRFGSVHLAGRLDREASGVVLVLRTPEARWGVPALRRRGLIERTYVALSDRVPVPAAGTVEVDIGPDAARPGRMRLGGPGGRAAQTAYESDPVGPGAEIVARPRTGRTHQVRLHLSSVGAPILGDRLYGGAARLGLPDGRIASAPRLALHCAQVRLPHPATGVTVVGRSELPGDLCLLRDALSAAQTLAGPSARPGGRRRSRE